MKKIVENFLKGLEKKGFSISFITDDEIEVKKNHFSTTITIEFLNSFLRR